MASGGVWAIGGIVDPDYRGEIVVVLHNGSNVPYEISIGDKIAQLVCYRVYAQDAESSELNDRSVQFVTDADLPPEQTERGERGFGSSDA